MKKFVLSMLVIALTGCAALQDLPFLQSPTAAPTSSPEMSVTPLTPRVSNTPDLFAISTPTITSTFDPNAPIPTNTPIPTSTRTVRPTITLEPVDISLFTPGPNPFVLLSKSTTQLVWGFTCDGAREIKFVVQLIQPLRRLKFVTLWYRLQDKYSAMQTDWGGGVIMLDNDRGTYYYTVALDQIKDYEKFYDAWLQFQFVASTVSRKRLGSSVVDRTSVSLTHCSVFNP